MLFKQHCKTKFEIEGRLKCNPFVLDHLAVHSLLDLAKLPLERKRISYRKICDIDFSEFCGQLENTRLVRDAASFSLGELVYEYNTTLKSLLDRQAPLKTKTITSYSSRNRPMVH